MSSLFFDQLLDLKKIDKKIKKVSSSYEEKAELWQIVDEIIHHRVFGCVMDKLPKKYHSEFVELFEKTPNDQKLIGYLKAKTKTDIENLIKDAVAILTLELISEFETRKTN